MNKIKKIFSGLMASMLLFAQAAMPISAAAPWNVTGTYEITFFLAPDTSVTPYVHHATLVQSGSTLTGSGGYPATGGDVYHWNVTSGSQTGDSINLTAVYDLGAIGTTMHMVGNIAADGSVTGTWDDNFGGPRTGTWSMTKGVSVPLIFTPANNAVVTQAAMVKVDWTDSVGANPPFQYMYAAFSDAGYTTNVYTSGWLAASEIPTPGTPPGVYYLQVKARNATDESAWSNGAGNPYKITVTANNAFPVPAECDQTISYNLIEGTNGSNTLIGTSGPDLILGKDGTDTIDGKGGNDCIDGGNGSDTINGGAGDDVILGRDGTDTIQGGDGNDKIYGGAGSDTIAGGAGDDQMWGEAGSDTLSGGTGVDQADGGANTDACSAETMVNCNP